MKLYGLLCSCRGRGHEIGEKPGKVWLVGGKVSVVAGKCTYRNDTCHESRRCMYNLYITYDPILMSLNCFNFQICVRRIHLNKYR